MPSPSELARADQPDPAPPLTKEREETEKAVEYLRRSLANATAEEPELMGIIPAKTLRLFLAELDRLRAALAKAEGERDEANSVIASIDLLRQGIPTQRKE